MKRILLILILVLTQAIPVFAATRYVRCASLGSSQDGGTGYDASENPTGHCNGTADVAYDGAGTNENCAWNNPMWALSWKDGAYPQKIAGGDTLIITGDCEVGFGADGNTFDHTALSQPWDAYLKPVPSGPDAAHPTKILGANYATCSGKADTAKLTGVERVDRVLNLDGTSNFQVKCLSVTDGLNCAESGANTAVNCKRTDDATSQGKWAKNGITLLDSDNGLFDHVYVFGLANKGVFAGRIKDFTWDHGEISDNAFGGWENDRGDPDNWANGGLVTIKGSVDDKFKIWWNGCVGTDSSTVPIAGSCTTQGQGQGQGDGWAIADRVGALGGANYVFDNVDFSYNTSDNLDNLYKKSGKTTTITRSRFSHGTGNAIKIAGPAVLNDVQASADCDFFLGKSYTYTGDGGFTHCRASGNTIAWNAESAGETIDIFGSTITGKGDVLIQTSGVDGICNGTERVRVKNSIMQGDAQYGGGDTTDDFYNAGQFGNGDGSCGAITLDWSSSGSGNIIYATKNNDTGAGITNSDPLLTDKYNDLSISSSSPARGKRNTSFGNSTDYNGYARSTASGALEYGSATASPACANTCSLCGDNSACSGSAATCYWWSTNTCKTTAEGPICANTCSQCANQSTCAASGASCHWWTNSTCNAATEPNSCSTSCSLCANQTTCQSSSATCYWWTNSTCHNIAEAPAQTPFSFTGKCTLTGKAVPQ